MDSTEELESPRRFWFWSGLASISAAVKDNVYFDRYAFKTYPNIYVLIVAPAGGRKGPPIALAKELVSMIPTARVIDGQNSIQGVIAELSTQRTVEGDDKVLDDSSGFLVSSEFATFLVQDDSSIVTLTDLYDRQYHSTWTKRLKSSGKERLKEPTLTMLAGTNMENFNLVIPKDSIGGGFLSRTLMISEERRHRHNSLMVRPAKVPDVKLLGDYLNLISKLKGAFECSFDVREMYSKWYIEFSERMENKRDGDVTHMLDRLGDQVIKTAMLLSLSRTTDLIISKEDMDQAIHVCLEVLPGAKRAVMGSGKSVLGPVTAIFLNALVKAENYTISRRKVLQGYWGDMDVIDLDRIVETAKQAGMIKEERHGTECFYILSDMAVEKYLKAKGN